MYHVIEGKFTIDENNSVNISNTSELQDKQNDAYFPGTRVYINRYMNSIMDRNNSYNYIQNDDNNAMVAYLRTQINTPNKIENVITYQFKIAFTKQGEDSVAHFICTEP
jgi:hypothetical protein